MAYFRIARMANNPTESTTYLHTNENEWVEVDDGNISIYTQQDYAVRALSFVLSNLSYQLLTDYWFGIEVSKSPVTVPVVWPTDDGYEKLPFY